ncbi:MAG: hypothetical protein R3213_08380, partial [Flavobacteriaceae bacterium]|nr:hypothetical protein [Flavobacteriaceae bacterium]
MKILRLAALTSFILAYIMVIGNMVSADVYTPFTPFYVFAMWAIGIVAEISNVLFAIRLKIKTWITILLAV